MGQEKPGDWRDSDIKDPGGGKDDKPSPKQKPRKRSSSSSSSSKKPTGKPYKGQGPKDTH
jgi:hypothetical protein